MGVQVAMALWLKFPGSVLIKTAFHMQLVLFVTSGTHVRCSRFFLHSLQEQTAITIDYLAEPDNLMVISSTLCDTEQWWSNWSR